MIPLVWSGTLRLFLSLVHSLFAQHSEFACALPLSVKRHQVFASRCFPSPFGNLSSNPFFRSRFRPFICGTSTATYQPHQCSVAAIFVVIRRFVPSFTLSACVFAEHLPLHTATSEVFIMTSFVAISMSIHSSWPLVRSKLVVNHRPKVMSKFYSLSDFVPVIRLFRFRFLISIAIRHGSVLSCIYFISTSQLMSLCFPRLF